MGRENMNNDQIVIQSSIALLQERFRQLQRAKEMRAERELHKLQYYEPSRCFFHFLPPAPQVSVSVWSNAQTKLQKQNDDFHFMETSLLMSLQPTTTTTTSETSSMHASAENIGTSDFDDVDTSLHL